MISVLLPWRSNKLHYTEFCSNSLGLNAFKYTKILQKINGVHMKEKNRPIAPKSARANTNLNGSTHWKARMASSTVIFGSLAVALFFPFFFLPDFFPLPDFFLGGMTVHLSSEIRDRLAKCDRSHTPTTIFKTLHTWMWGTGTKPLVGGVGCAGFVSRTKSTT